MGEDYYAISSHDYFATVSQDYMTTAAALAVISYLLSGGDEIGRR
jgi:hypothetical protein